MERNGIPSGLSDSRVTSVRFNGTLIEQKEAEALVAADTTLFVFVLTSSNRGAADGSG